MFYIEFYNFDKLTAAMIRAIFFGAFGIKSVYKNKRLNFLYL